MTKTMSKETKVKRIIRMINDGKTWEECADFFGNSEKYLQKIVRESYKTPTRYNNLLRKARANKTAAAKIEEIEEVESEIEEVILVETGYLLEKGVSVFIENVIPIYIPLFCIQELEKMAKDKKTAEEILAVIYSTSVNQINLRGQEYAYVKRPSFEYRPRSKGIAAAAKYLAECYPHVRVLTNSYEVEKILKEQESDNINVILDKIPKAS